jgi:hypothetical protein
LEKAADLIRSETASTVRASALRSKVLSLANTCEIGRVGGRKKRRAPRADQAADRATFVRPEVVHNFQCRQPEALDVSPEAVAIDGAVHKTRCGDAILAQRSKEGGCASGRAALEPAAVTHAGASRKCNVGIAICGSQGPLRRLSWVDGCLAAPIRIMVSVVPSSKWVTSADYRPSNGGRGDVAEKRCYRMTGESLPLH